MAEVIRMPRMSDTMEEGVIVEWLKEVGDKVEPGDVLAEVETDKATMELESYQEGTLLYIGVKEGPVPVNGILAVIGEEDEDYQEALDAASKEDKNDQPGAAKTDEAESEAQPEEKASAPESKAEEEVPQTPGGRIKASPLARAMARESGIDLGQVSGSGDHGRIIKRDIESFLEEEKEAPQRAIAVSAEEKSEAVSISQMRKTIAKRLAESKFGAPHFYLTVEIDMERVMEARQAVNEHAPPKISFNDIIIKACAMALRQHQAVNSSWKGDRILAHKHIHIGVAVAVDEGLVVPVVRHTDFKSLSQINAEVADLAERARKRKLTLEEMQGNTFSVSNLGMFGIEEFTAIINPPDSCILAVGSIVQKPVVKDGNLAIGHRMRVTLSCDHRVVDGATGARFLDTFKGFMENPLRILV